MTMMASPNPSTFSAQRQHLWGLSLVLLAVTLLSFSPVLKNGFVNIDDQLYVTSNPQVQSGLHAESLRWAFTTTEGGNYHPLTWVSHLVDVEWFGMNPAGHHAHSLVLHAVNGVLLFWVMLRLVGSTWLAFFVAALFALHPLRVESVAWVSERKDVLSGFYFLVTLLLYAGYAASLSQEASPASPGGGQPRRRGQLYYWSALTAFALGLLAKPMLVTVPCVLLLLDVWPLGRLRAPWSPALLRSCVVLEKLPFFVLTAVASVLTFRAQAGVGAVSSTDVFPFGDRLANSLLALVRYLAKTFWPADLAPFYPLTLPVPIGSAVAAGVILVVITLLAWWSFRRQPSFLVGWLWFVGMLVPVIGLVQVGMQSMADRYTYLPGIGLAIAVVWGVSWVGQKLERSALLPVLGSIACVVCAWLSFNQTQVWKDSETLFRHTLGVAPRNAVAHISLGNALAASNRLPEALEQFQLAVADNPNNPQAHCDLGFALVMSGRLPEGMEHYRLALRSDPNFQQAHENLGRALAILGRHEEALQSFESALRLRPGTEMLVASAESLAALGRLPEAEQRLRSALQDQPANLQAQVDLAEVLASQGDATKAVTQMEAVLTQNPAVPELRLRAGALYSRLGLYEQAAAQFREALRLRVDPQAYFGLATALDALGRHGEAAAQYRESLRLAPQAVAVLNNLAWLLATTGDDAVRNGAEAVKLAETLNAQTENTQAMFLGTLAAAYAEAGRFEDAIRTAERARQTAEANRQPDVAKRNAELIELYRAGKPFRQPAH